MHTRIGRAATCARIAVLPVVVALAMVVTAVPVAAATPNHSLFLWAGGKAETGVLTDSTYTKKRAFNLAGVTAAAATRSSLALYTKGTGKLRTGTFRNGVWTPVETITVRSGFTHAIGSCDSLLLYNKLSGRVMTGTLIGGRFRNRTSYTITAGYTALGSSCDTTWFTGPNTTPALPPNGVSGTLSGGDWQPTGDIYTSGGMRIGMGGTTYMQFYPGEYAAWGSAVGGVIDQKASQDTLQNWNVITGAASSFLYYMSSGYACVQRMASGVAGAANCAPNIVTAGWKIIVGGR